MTATDSLAMNLRRVRVIAGLSQEAAAEKAGLTRVAYRNLEAGSSQPRPQTLIALSEALRVSVADLLRPAIPLPRARFRSLKRMNNREELLLTVARQVDDYAGLEELLGERSEFLLESLVGTFKPGEDGAREAARAVRKALKLSEREVIQDIAGMLEDRAGIKVMRVVVASDAFFGLSIAADGLGPVIVVNTWDRISVERWIFSAAHELGHLLLHVDDFDPAVATEDGDSERDANVFAGEFLMPAAAFEGEWADSAGLDLFARVLKVKRIFGVSYKTVLYRLQAGVPDIWPRFQGAARRHLGRTLAKTDEPAPLSKDAFGYGNPEWRKAQEPKGLTGADFVPDRRARLVRSAIDQGEISIGRGAEILGMDLRAMKDLQQSWV